MVRLLIVFSCVSCTAKAEPDVVAGFRVKFVHDEAVYLEAGSVAGLTEGQRLTIRRSESDDIIAGPTTVGEIEIESVASTSAAGRIVSSQSDIVPGDRAYFTTGDLRQLRQDAVARETRKYPQIAAFTEGAPPEQETRESIPKPPLPEVNRVRARVGVDSSILQIPGSGVQSTQFGFMLRLDATRLGSTYWSVRGYHRGRYQMRKDYQQETLSDLINRTYTFSINYDSPKSNWVAGFGRLYVPWAASLSTIDGFYLGRRLGRQTVGAFGGTTPDPSSWNYDRHRTLAGAFANLERGSSEAVRLSSTAGVAISRVHWQPDRQFAFFENGIYYKSYFSIYSNQEVDLLTSSQTGSNREVKLSRSYVTVRLQPHPIIAFDINENYFRNVPTFDARLIGTGLLDKFLFQGLSGGFRLSLPCRFSLYGNTGRSSRTGDERASWNYLGGASLGDILHSGVRLDYRYSRFDSSFGRGTYQTVTADRQVGEGLRFEMQAGQQSLSSSFTDQSRARFINGTVDWYVGTKYIVGLGFTAYRGQVQHYNQYFLSLGYRFDNRKRDK
jgi:hypothetical protein